MVTHNKRKRKYRARHSIFYGNYLHKSLSAQSDKRQGYYDIINYLKKLAIQSLICLCFLMVILIMEQEQTSKTYKEIREIILREIPFSRYNEAYQTFLVNLFPFSYRVPAKQPGLTTPVSGTITSNQENSPSVDVISASQLASEIYDNIELSQYADGVIVQTLQNQEISSFISGVVIEKGVNENKQIDQFITIQQSDDWLVTIGFLEEVMVSRLEHIEVGDSLGLGTTIPSLSDDKAYYYLSIQSKDNEYVDIKDYLYQMINEIGE